MNIKITHNWLKEYLETDATPYDIQKYVSLCGPSIEAVTRTQNNDFVYDIEITTNRIDNVSVIGIAREAATILSRNGFNAVFKHKPSPKTISSAGHMLPLDVSDEKQLCRRVLAIVMDNIEIKPSPSYIQERLNAIGIRSLNNVVDVTNYVMMEIGHPCHVFDYDRIKTHSLIIRRALPNEAIITLDEKQYHLSVEDIVIDDGSGKVIDLPGIMGTANSVVTPDTKRIIFFIESNDPVAIRRSSMRYGIRTLAATINEKSPDPETAKEAFLRGIELFKEIAHARTASTMIDLYPDPVSQTTIKTSVGFLHKKIGVAIPEDQIKQILEGLSFDITISKNGLMTAEVPLFRRNDVTIAEDLVEEIARIYGYHNLPNNLAPIPYIEIPHEMEQLFEYQNIIKLFLKHLGLHEVLNYSMTSLQILQKCDLIPENHLYLSNVMSEDIKYLRTSLLPSLIQNIKSNEGRKKNLALFELAKVYIPQKDNLPQEIYKLAIIVNSSYPEMKGILEALFHELHIANYSYKRSSHDLYNKSTATDIFLEQSHAGSVGKLKAKYTNRFDIKSDCYMAEIDFQALIDCARKIAPYKSPHPYAIIKLDLTLELTPILSYETIRNTSHKLSPHLHSIDIIDQYKNRITLRFYFSSEKRNLTEKEAQDELSIISKTLISV